MGVHETITGTALEVSERAERTLFRAEDPIEVLAAATRVAGAFKQALADGKMVQRIGKREYVRVEGWQTVGAMLGIVPIVVWSRPLETDGEVDGWEARVEARTLDGRTVGAAEAQCDRTENTWHHRDDYTLRSMAQTRATAKALKGPLGFIVTLAGHDTTPAEEIADTPNGHGEPAGPDDHDRAGKALLALYGGDITATDRALKDIFDDAGYLPKAAARALQYAAKNRPQPAQNGE